MHLALLFLFSDTVPHCIFVTFKDRSRLTLNIDLPTRYAHTNPEYKLELSTYCAECFKVVITRVPRLFQGTRDNLMRWRERCSISL